MFHYNRNTINVDLCETLNNYYKLLVIIVICNEQQDHLRNKQYYFKTSKYFYQKLYHFYFNAGKTGNVPELKFDKHLEEHLFEMI